jgi:nicotinate-nucleotide adenylyltransferase
MKVAIYGGSFDPLHIGHIKVVNQALEILEIDQLIILPNYQNPFKSTPLFTSSERLDFLHRVFDSYEKVMISDFEIKHDRPMRSFDSVEALTQPSDHVYFIIGADNLASLHQWHNYDLLNEKVSWVVATRNQIPIDIEATILSVDMPISSTMIKQSADERSFPKEIAPQIIQRIQMQQRIEKIVSVLDSHKAEEIEVINMDDADYFVQHVIIATATSNRHANALLDYLKKELKQAPYNEEFLYVEESDDWIAIDLGDFLIHIMTATYRERYNIEKFLAELKG